MPSRGVPGYGEKSLHNIVSIALVGLVWVASIQAQTASREVKVLHRLLAPLRSNPFRVENSRPCGLGFASCFLPSDSSSTDAARSAFDRMPTNQAPSRVVT